MNSEAATWKLDRKKDEKERQLKFDIERLHLDARIKLAEVSAKNGNGSDRTYSEGVRNANISESHFVPRHGKCMVKYFSKRFMIKEKT